MVPMPPILTTLASLATPETLPPDATRRGWAMFSIVALLGITLVACTAMMALLSARRRRRSKQLPVRAADPRDPWEESANRMQEIEGPEPAE